MSKKGANRLSRNKATFKTPRTVSKSKAKTSKRLPVRGIDYPTTTLADASNYKEVGGMEWAMQKGYAHVKRLNEKDAKTVLTFLQLCNSSQQYSDALGDLMYYNNPWGWLEKYDDAGGNLKDLKVKAKL